MRLIIAIALLMPGVAWGQISPAPFTLNGQNVDGATSASATGMSRTMSARVGDTFNPLEYGAVGKGRATPIGMSYGSNLASLAAFATAAGAHPFAFATDPKFGLVFSMTPSAASSTATQTFLFDHGGPNASAINGIRATVAIWQDPAYGNYLVTPGMLVTGACITGPTTVTSVGRNPGPVGAADPTYGTVTLSAAPASACSGSTPLTFTMAPAQVQALTMDWLGWQAAIAQAYYALTGGSVRAPQGLYVLNHSLLNPGGITDSNQLTSSATVGSNIDVGGAGIAETTLWFQADLGLDMGAITEANSAGESVTSASAYHDFHVKGPANGRVNGQGSTLNGVPVGMDGLRIGRGAELSRLNISGMYAGVSGINDHWEMHGVLSGNNACGVLFRPYTYTMGNQMIEDGSLAANAVGSVCVSTTGQMDSSLVKNVHTGFAAHGFWYLPDTANTVVRAAFLTNTTLIDVWIEGIGHCWICSAAHKGDVVGNTFISGGGDGVYANPTFQIPNGSGGYVPPTALVDAGDFIYNNMIGTNWSPFARVSDAVVVSLNGSCYGNHWQNDGSFVFGPTPTTSSIPTVSQFDCAYTTTNNTFTGAFGSGVFRTVNGNSNLSQYEALSEFGYNGVAAFGAGNVGDGGFAGLAATAMAGGSRRTVAVLKSAPAIPPVGIGGPAGMSKTSQGQSIHNSQPVFAEVGGTVSGGLSQAHAIGIATNDSGAGNGVVQITLDPGVSGGAPGAVTGLTAAGTSQGTAFVITAETSEFTAVASGAGALLGIIPVGSTETVCNDGANAENVYPQAGSTIQGLAANVAASVPAATCMSFRRLSATLWHR